MMLQVIHKPTGRQALVSEQTYNADPSRFELMGQVSQEDQDVAGSAVEQPQNKSIEGFLNNIVSSTGKAVTDIGSAAMNVFNPNLGDNTIANIGKLALGAGELLVPGEQKHENIAKDFGKFYDERYGFSDLAKGNVDEFLRKVGETAYTDPVGGLLDVSALAGGGGAAASGLGKVSKSAKLAKLGKGLSGVSKTLDPLSQMSKAAKPLTSRAGKATSALGKSLIEKGKSIPSKILKVTQTQLDRWDNVSQGIPFDDFLVKEGLVGRGKSLVGKIDNKIKGLQSKYNNLARGKGKIDPSRYVDALNQKITELQSGNYSRAAQKVVEELERIRDTFVDGVIRNNEIDGIPIEKLTDIKSSQFGKRGLKKSFVYDAEDIAGKTAIELIDEFAPGSKEIGLKLQKLRTVRDIAAKKANVGRGTNLLSFINPVGTGSGLGLMLGAATGNPLVGLAAGALTGIASESVPGMKALGKAEQIAGRAIQGLPGKTSSLMSRAEPAVVAASRLTPNMSQEVSSVINQGGQQEQQGYNQQLPHTFNIPQEINQQTAEQAVQYATGRSPQEHLQAYSQAVMAGDMKAAAAIMSMFEAEQAFQETQGGGNKKLTGGQATELSDLDVSIQTMNRANQVVDQYADIMGPIKGQLAKSPYATEQRIFDSEMKIMAQNIGKALEGGKLAENDIQRYREMLPSITDTPQIAKGKIQNVMRMLQTAKQVKQSTYGSSSVIPEYMIAQQAIQ